jgi:hypothetical protein
MEGLLQGYFHSCLFTVIKMCINLVLKNHTNAHHYVYCVEAVLDWLVNTPFYFLSVLLNIFYTANISHFTHLEYCFE